MWISRKKWDEYQKLKNLFSFLEEINDSSNCCYNDKGIYTYKNITFMNNKTYIEMVEKIFDLEKQVKDVETYNRLYLDEFQKRLELAEMVRKMNGD